MKAFRGLGQLQKYQRLLDRDPVQIQHMGDNLDNPFLVGGRHRLGAAVAIFHFPKGEILFVKYPPLYKSQALMGQVALKVSYLEIVGPRLRDQLSRIFLYPVAQADRKSP